MWGGLVSAIPSGWVLCNGTNGTPDLRDKFVKGAANGANPGATGGVTQHTHVLTQPSDHPALTHSGATVGDHTAILAHTHGLTVQGGTSASTSGTHVMTSASTGGSARSITAGDAVGSSGTGAAMVHAVGQAANHAVQSHSGGSAATSGNEPPYYALCFIQKV